MEPPRYFCALSKTVATRANLPHWSQRCACFLTFRLADSLPSDKLAVLAEERDSWLKTHPEPWNDADEDEYYSLFNDRVQGWLDSGHGSCVLGRADIREIVATALRHFADVRYSLYAYVVMPNHVHVLFMPNDGNSVPEIVQGWKSYTSKVINRALGLTGVLWQKESWDRLVRNVEQFTAYRNYIVRNNPSIAFDSFR